MKNIKKVIITGGYGFIGSNLVKYLLGKNYFVINIDKLSYSANLYNLKDLKTNNYIFYKSDINNKTSLLKILKKHKPSVVFNLAAETHVDRSIDNPEPFVKNNIYGVFNILESIRIYKKQTYNKIKLVCASPPYINAFDYVRILRLENVWLRNLDDNNIIKHKKNQIGTEQIYANEYNELTYKFGIKELDNKIDELYKIDKKRAHIVCKYFKDMEENIINIRKYLKEDGSYVLVVGDCEIRKILFPVYKYLIEIAEKNNYKNSKIFSYLIRNPYLRIPRKKRGGLIKYDRIIVLNK